MNAIVEIILVLTCVLFAVIILVQKGTIMAIRSELNETKRWIKNNHVSDFWNR